MNDIFCITSEKKNLFLFHIRKINYIRYYHKTATNISFKCDYELQALRKYFLSQLYFPPGEQDIHSDACNLVLAIGIKYRSSFFLICFPFPHFQISEISYQKKIVIKSLNFVTRQNFENIEHCERGNFL